MENLFNRIEEKKKEFEIIKKEVNIEDEKQLEYLEDYIDESNLNIVDSVIDYCLLVRLPEFINKEIDKARSAKDLEDLTFRINFDYMYGDSQLIGTIESYCKKIGKVFDNKIKVNPNEKIYNTGCDGLYVDYHLFNDIFSGFRQRLNLYNKKDNQNEKSKLGIICFKDLEDGIGKIRIIGTAKDLANVYYSELQAYNYKNDKEYDKKDLQEKTYSFRYKVNTSSSR